MRFHGDGYIRTKIPYHPNADVDGYVLEHRLVMEEYLGRYLEPHEIVHHINGDKQYNGIENLQIMTQSKHLSDHLTKDMSNRICLECKSNKTYSRHWHKYKNGYLCHKCYCYSIK